VSTTDEAAANDPSATEAEMNKTAIALTGAALGAGAMYLLDPTGGRRRRARVGDAVAHASHRARAMAGARARDAGHRMSGLAARTLGRMGRDDTPADDVLVARVRARLGRLVSHPGAIGVTVDQGTVTVTGPVFAAEVDQLIAGLADVPGVTGVENRLESHADAEHIPSLQGGGPHLLAAEPPRRVRWTPALGVMAGVTALALVALSRRVLPAELPMAAPGPAGEPQAAS
jgi:osmotically-inducible protein OsmY